MTDPLNWKDTSQRWRAWPLYSGLSLGPSRPATPPVPTLTHTLSYLHPDGGRLHADSPLAQTKPLFRGRGE